MPSRSRSKTDQPVKPPPGRDALSANEAAWVFGVSASTVRRLVRTGELSAFRVGRSIRVSRDEIARYINRNARRTA